jgi:hypothetical protein
MKRTASSFIVEGAAKMTDEKELEAILKVFVETT